MINENRNTNLNSNEELEYLDIKSFLNDRYFKVRIYFIYNYFIKQYYKVNPKIIIKPKERYIYLKVKNAFLSNKVD